MWTAVTEAVSRRAHRTRGPRLPPGPDWPAPVQVGLWLFRPFELLTHCRRRFGPTFTMHVARWDQVVVVSEPDAIREVFTGPTDVMHAGPANDLIRPVVGEGSLLLLDGERHVRERRLLMPPFHGERMSRYGEVMREITLREMERWPVGAPLAIHGPMQSITLDVILRTVFGVDEGAELDALRAAIVDLTNGFNAFNMVQALRRDLGPRSPWGAFVRRRDAVDALLYQVIRARRAEGDSGRDDVMTLLTSARYEDGAAMDDRALRDELMTLLAAGHETTATALPWTLHELALRPEVQARVHDELDAGGHAYLDAVIKETMRLHPVISAIGRVLQRPHSVAGWDLPAGTLVSPSIYLAHRDPVAWPDPERFDPTRFLDARISPYAYLPFGGGARRCIGMAFALYEMRVVLATMLARFRVRPAPGVRIRPRRRGVSMAPSDGMPLVLARR